MKIYHGDYYNQGENEESCGYIKQPCPKEIDGSFNCDVNDLVDFTGGPSYVGQDYDASHNNRLTSLKGIASEIRGTLFLISCGYNLSLVGAHKYLKSCAFINMMGTTIKSGGLSLLLVKDLQEISSNQKAFTIINKYLWRDPSDKSNIFRCQKELVDAGYEEFAKL